MYSFNKETVSFISCSSPDMNMSDDTNIFLACHRHVSWLIWLKILKGNYDRINKLLQTLTASLISAL